MESKRKGRGITRRAALRRGMLGVAGMALLGRQGPVTAAAPKQRIQNR